MHKIWHDEAWDDYRLQRRYETGHIQNRKNRLQRLIPVYRLNIRRKMKIAVYCGSDFGKDPVYTEAARELGKWIGERGNTLVYGGGEAGLMGTVAKEVHDAGCEVIGVVPGNVDFIKDRPQPYVTKLITTENMSDRKQTMLELADAFIALPGGIGTLDEISEAITLTKIGVFNKPCILFNRNNFYAPLKKMFDDMEQAGFLWGDSMGHVLFSDDVVEIERFLKCN